MGTGAATECSSDGIQVVLMIDVYFDFHKLVMDCDAYYRSVSP